MKSVRLIGWAGGHGPTPLYIHNVIHFWKALECIPVRAAALKTLKGEVKVGGNMLTMFTQLNRGSRYTRRI